MRLHNLTSTPGARHRSKRKGIGVGTGNGKTSGRGHKGQRARSGGSIRVGFEGGQMPLYRQLPHRGFNNKRFQTDYEIVNLSSLEKAEGAEFDHDTLAKAGIIRGTSNILKVLGNGEISRAITIKANKVSASARQKIESAGGKVEII